MCLVNLLECFVDALYGEAHHVVVTAVKSCDADIAYPFLNAVGASLIEGLVFCDVIVDLIVGELLEGDVGGNGKASLSLMGKHTDTRCDLMGTAADKSQHPFSILLVDWLAQYLVTYYDYGVSSNHEFVFSKGRTIGISLLACDIQGHLRHGQIIRITLVDILQHPHLERHP